MVDLNDLDVEQIVAYEGCDYKLSNGNNGLQINIKSCPVCGCDDWKIYLNAETGLGNCFKCSKGFNKYGFVKASRGFKQHGDVMRYFESMGEYVSYRPKLVVHRKSLNTDWVLPQNFKIELDEDVPSYLKARNVDAKLCKRFDLRICNHGFYHYQDFSERDKVVDFSQRIIIPIKDVDGNLVTFQGRDITGTSEKRYLFPNMLPGTARFIYNSNYALDSKAKKVVLNEGVFDVFAMTQALESDLLYKDFVACGTFGKHLSISARNMIADDQLSDLFKLWEAGVDEFIILWDGEGAAIQAAFDAALKLNSFGLHTTVAKIGGGLDPAETDWKVLLQAIDDRVKPSRLDFIRRRLNNEFS